jgi:putative transposase
MKKPIKRLAAAQELLSHEWLPLVDVLRAGLFEAVVAAGSAEAMRMLEEQRDAICGPRYRHLEERAAYRHGSCPGSVVMGGRRVTMPRPRVRSAEGKELELPLWSRWSQEDPLEQRAMKQMLLGVSTRRYAGSLEQLPTSISVRGTSRSAVSRRFVAGTKKRLGDLMRRDLSKLDLLVLMIDGVHFEDHVVLAALGITADGTKQVLGLWEGATENATACKGLLGDLASRGLRTDQTMLVVLDGAKALRKAVKDVFGDRALIQRCQEHKRRNVAEQLPESMRKSVRRAMKEAYRCRDAKRARRLLDGLAERLDVEHPGAAASLREGLDETLTVLELGLPDRLEQTLRTTNPIDNIFGGVRDRTRRVKKWKGGRMILRWCAVALLDAEANFRRIRGHAEMPKLVTALRTRDAVDHVNAVA